MIGKRIKELRSKAGLSQEIFGDKISHTKSTISKWENGGAIPDIYTLQKIANLFDVDINYFIKEEEAPDIKNRALIESSSIITNHVESPVTKPIETIAQNQVVVNQTVINQTVVNSAERLYFRNLKSKRSSLIWMIVSIAFFIAHITFGFVLIFAYEPIDNIFAYDSKNGARELLNVLGLILTFFFWLLSIAISETLLLKGESKAIKKRVNIIAHSHETSFILGFVFAILMFIFPWALFGWLSFGSVIVFYVTFFQLYSFISKAKKAQRVSAYRRRLEIKKSSLSESK